MFMRKKMKDYLASVYNTGLEATLSKLLGEKLISEKDIETIRKGKSDGRPDSPDQVDVLECSY
jgi:hypothetical protein